MAKKQKDPVVLNHDGKEYTEAELRDIPNAHRAYLHILNINRKIENSVFNNNYSTGDYDQDGGVLYANNKVAKIPKVKNIACCTIPVYACA